MGFENFGTVTFTSESRTEDFITYLEQGKVMTTRCKKCGTSYFPPKMDCPACLDSEAEWFEIKNNGKLITYTTVHYGPSGFEDEAPYTLGIGEFDDKLRVFGRLSKDIKENDIESGIGIKVVSVKLPDDRIAYEFIKA
ncbi:Zn-ribbon domain-containing OB-fold protein [Chloroflexota bacterium]